MRYEPSPILAVMTVLIMVSSSAGCFGDDDASGDDTAVGDFKYHYLRDRYPDMVVEIDHVSGFAPSSDAKNTLETRIKNYCDKDSVSYKVSSFQSDDESYTLKEIKELAKEHRTEDRRGGDKVSMHVLYLNGEYAENSNTLGLAYEATSIAIFKEKIDDAAENNLIIQLPFLVNAEDIEKAVLVHEWGHLLGLVNIGYTSERDHHDTNHRHHCKHDDCVMYWQIESSSIVNYMNSGQTKPPTDFDPDCVADLEMLKG